MEPRKASAQLHTYAFLFVFFVVIPLLFLGVHYQISLLKKLAIALFFIACLVSLIAVVKAWCIWIKEKF